jgi:SAM-dependent methyltransferase
MSHEAVFTRIYRGSEWLSDESRSGPGSELVRTAALRRELPELLGELGVAVLLDAGCGDFRWLSETELPVREYIGVEVVGELAAELERRYTRPGRRFVQADITRDELPPADVILCRDVLVHFPDDDILRALAAFRGTGAQWLLATTFTARETNEPIELGSWRTLNLEAPPFSFPPPERLLDDIPIRNPELGPDKRLALWRLRSA